MPTTFAQCVRLFDTFFRVIRNMSSSSSSSSYSSNSSSQHANRTKELPMYDCSKNYKNIANSGWCGTGWDDDGENHNRSRMDSKLQSAKTTLERS